MPKYSLPSLNYPFPFPFEQQYKGLTYQLDSSGEKLEMIFIKFAESPSLLIILQKGQAFGDKTWVDPQSIHYQLCKLDQVP